MRFFRTVFIPLLLCGAILAVGFFSPALFSALVSDRKNQAERVAIAGKESPLYLEGDTELTLPPWDVIGGPGTPLSAYSDDVWSSLNSYVAALLELFDCAPARSEDFTGSMYVYDDRLLYLRDYPFQSADRCTLDLVLDYESMLPIYFHVRSLAHDTAPADSPDALLTSFRRAADIWTGTLTRYYASGSVLTWDVFRDQIAQDTYTDAYAHEDAVTLAFIQFFNAVALQFDVPPTADSEDSENNSEDSGNMWYSLGLWESILISMQDCYTLTYDSETVLVLTDSSNFPCTLYYDADQNQVTGFGIDAARFGYTAEATSRPIETP